MCKASRIIGHAKERAQFHRLLTAASKGGGQVVLLSGEPGVGKTNLALTSLSECGFNVYRGRAIERGTAAYGPIAAALRDCLRQTGGDVRECGPLSKYLGILLPELEQPVPELADPAVLVEAIATALSAKAQSHPMALLLDDLHWADESTVDLLPILAERLQGDPVALIGTYRDEEIGRGHPIRRLKGELLRLRMLREIPIEPLSEDETGELLSARLGGSVDQTLRTMVFQRTRGLPLYIEELADALELGSFIRQGKHGFEPVPDSTVPVPASIRDMVALRLERLSEKARAQLYVAAVIGDEFNPDFLKQMVYGDDGLNELLDAGFIAETLPGRCAFRHTLTREAILEEVPWSDRRRLHREVAEQLEGRDAPQEQIANHWAAASELERARRAFLAAADRSHGIHAYRDAYRNYERALETWPVGDAEEERSAALERQATCAQTVGLITEAIQVWERYTQSPVVQTVPLHRARALRAIATLHELRGENAQAIDTRLQAARAFQEAGLPAEAVIELLERTERYIINAQPTPATETAREALQLADDAQRPDLQARAKGILAYATAMLGKIEDARPLAHDALTTALSLNAPNLVAEMYRYAAGVAEYSSEFAMAREAYTTALNYCRDRDEDVHTNLCMGCMSYVLFRAGKWRQSLDLCKEIMQLEEGIPYPDAVAKGVMGMIKAYRGELKPAKKMIAESNAGVQALGGVIGEFLTIWFAAFAHETSGELDEAANTYRRFIRMWEKTEDYHDAIPGFCAAATFFASQELADDVTICANALSTMATGSGHREAVAALAFVLGERAMVDGKYQEAADHFKQAATRFEPLEVPVERARAEWRAGAALAQAGAKEEAVGYLRNAYRAMRKLGARALSSRISADLNDLGEPTEERRRSKSHGLSDIALTKRQTDVARLLADGLTNKEIAEKLFVSPRTVDMHVAHILDRLDCRSRTEAARRIAELGLTSV